jgi:hypothetical protein
LCEHVHTLPSKHRQRCNTYVGVSNGRHLVLRATVLNTINSLTYALANNCMQPPPPPITEQQRWRTSYARNAAATILQAHVRGKQQLSKQAVAQRWRSHQLRSVLRLQAVGRGLVGRHRAQQQLRAKVTSLAPHVMHYSLVTLYNTLKQ